MTTKKIVLTLGVVVLTGSVLWSIYNSPLWVRDIKENPELTPSSAVSGMATSGAEAKITSSDVKIEYDYAPMATGTSQKALKPRVDSPSLDRPVLIPTSFSPADTASAKEDIVSLIDAIKKSPGNGSLWADLGMKRKGIEDYEGAKEAYAYALKLMPNNAVVAENLGVIYADYLKDYPKAEQYFRLALKIDPATSYRYLRLFELYRYLLKDEGKAKAILVEGLRAIPGEPSLQVLLETM